VNNNNNEYFYTSNNLLLARLKVEWRNQVRTSIQRREEKVQTHTNTRAKKNRETFLERKLTAMKCHCMMT